MLVKVILLFLLVMALLAMIGRVLFPGKMGRLGRKPATKCPRCGRPKIGRGPCGCGGKA